MQGASTQQGPACHWECVADGDLSTPQLEPNCTVELGVPGNGGSTSELVDCERGSDGGYAIDPETGDYRIPEGQDLCFAMRVDFDGSQTLDPHDDLSAECMEEGTNLEFVIERRPGYHEPGGSWIVPSCTVTDCPDHCPGR